MMFEHCGGAEPVEAGMWQDWHRLMRQREPSQREQFEDGLAERLKTKREQNTVWKDRSPS